MLNKSWNHPLGGLIDFQRLPMVLKSSQGVIPAGNLLSRVLTICGFPHLFPHSFPMFHENCKLDLILDIYMC